MSRVFVHGWGAVSPAGWGAEALGAALHAGMPLPTGEMTSPTGRRLTVRRVPAGNPRPAGLAHPRLRRSSPISQFAVGAALEALGDRPPGDPARLGILCAVMGGSVIYSRRFFEEVLRDPPTASPMLFPETVFNAPASHIGAIVGSSGRNDTVVGDQSGFLHALALGATWLVEGVVDACVVVGSEEADWLTAEAAHLFHRRAVTAEGAGALLLAREPGAVELLGVTEPQPFVTGVNRAEAAQRVWAELSLGSGQTHLWDTAPKPFPRPPEPVTWLDPILGDGLAAAGAWACVAAARSLTVSGKARAAVRVVGANLQAIGAAFGPGPVQAGPTA